MLTGNAFTNDATIEYALTPEVTTVVAHCALGIKLVVRV